jgi:predicted dinucleotide-binding enzyme
VAWQCFFIEWTLEQTMNVGVLGSGDVAKVLPAGFLKHEHGVMVGTRAPAKLAEWSRNNPRARIGSLAETARFAEVAVLAVKGSVAAEVLRSVSAHLAGKTVIDTTNPISDVPPVNGVLGYFTSFGESLMERLQKAFPSVHLVKAFNSVGNARMVNPEYGGNRPTMFICGNDAAAKITVTELLDQFGWDAEDMGQVEGARAIEPLCMLWCIPGFLRNEWTHAFKLLK